MKKTFIVFCLLVIFSPWFSLITKNRSLLNSADERFISQRFLVDEINTLQGQSKKAGTRWGKIIVNKFTIYTMEVVKRYLESFDPQFLFFEGDIDIRKSTRSVGALYLTFLPLIVTGILKMIQEKDNVKKRILSAILFIAPIPSSFIFSHYETISKIPLLLILTFFAAYGFTTILSKRKTLALVLVIFLMFEFARFLHDIKLHYPVRFIEMTGQELSVTKELKDLK